MRFEDFTLDNILLINHKLQEITIYWHDSDTIYKAVLNKQIFTKMSETVFYKLKDGKTFKFVKVRLEEYTEVSVDSDSGKHQIIENLLVTYIDSENKLYLGEYPED